MDDVDSPSKSGQWAHRITVFDSMIDHAIPQVGPYAGAVLVALFKFGNAAGMTYVSPPTLANTLGVDKSHVYKRINTLYAAGWLELVKRGTGLRCSSRRRVCIPVGCATRTIRRNDQECFWDIFNAIVTRGYQELGTIAASSLLYAFRRTDDHNVAEIDHRKLAAWAKVGERTAKQHLSDLTDAGWLRTVQAGGGRGKFARRQVGIPTDRAIQSATIPLAVAA
jgi:hypothetical protein